MSGGKCTTGMSGLAWGDGGHLSGYENEAKAQRGHFVLCFGRRYVAKAAKSGIGVLVVS